MIVNIQKRKQEEQQIIAKMVRIYCQGKKHGNPNLCDSCQELLDYAVARINRCPVMGEKTFCSSCKIHCYSPEMRRRIKEVMRYSGPRMIMHHPILLMKHVWDGRKKEKSV